MRRKLQRMSLMNSPQSPPLKSFSANDDYVIMNVGMYVVSHDIVLACFHSDRLWNSYESEFSKGVCITNNNNNNHNDSNDDDDK